MPLSGRATGAPRRVGLGMDCTVTTGPLFLERDDRPTSFGAPSPLRRPDPPIYARLVAEWQARGRTVPGAPDTQWTDLASDAPSMTGESQYATTQGQGRREPRIDPSVSKAALVPVR